MECSVPELRRRRRCASVLLVACLLMVVLACGDSDEEGRSRGPVPGDEIAARLAKYVEVPLSADLSHLDNTERVLVGLFINACESMDAAFWEQAYGDGEAFLATLDDPDLRRLGKISYGPWDRLDGNEPFVQGKGPKPPGANFYPRDFTKEEFEAAIAKEPELEAGLRSPYTVIYRDREGNLRQRPYSEAFRHHMEPAVRAIRLAGMLTPNVGLHFYLHHRANALLTNEFAKSDEAWLELDKADIDLVIGPIETYEDELMGLKTAYTCYVLIRDPDWSERLARYAQVLPDLQRDLPVPEEYKREQPGSSVGLGVYDVIYYAGEANAGAKTIAVNLPNDERFQMEHGTRRLQLKNAMRAKFEKILVPLSEELIVDGQQQLVDFEAFFNNTMFHEIAHGLGIKNVMSGEGTVRDALQEQADSIEEGKADVLGLYMITTMHEKGEITEPGLESHFVTFLAGVLRSSRFGAASAHGRANLVLLDTLEEQGAFSRDAASGRYRVDVPKMRTAIDELSGMLLRLQGDGDYEGAKRLLETKGAKSPTLEEDLARLEALGIPVDVVWDQGYETLGLERPDLTALERGAAQPSQPR